MPDRGFPVKGMVKVCHIVSGDLWAGAEVVVFQLLKGLAACPDIAPTAIVLNEGRLAEEIRSLGIPIRVIDETKNSFYRILREARNWLRSDPPDCIHAHRYKENLLARLLGGGSKGACLFATQHGLPEFLGDKSGMRHRLVTRGNLRLLRGFHRIVCVSMDVRETLSKKYGFSETMTCTIQNGVELPGPARKDPRHERGGAFLIGSSGRFFPVKDYPLFVQVAKRIKSSGAPIRFELAGDGPGMEEVIRLLRKFELGDTVALKGFLHEMPPFYENLDVYLNTSIHEGMPMSVLEAMSCGLPVVAPNVGGFKEIIDDGIEGYLVDGRNPDSFAARCLSLFNDRETLTAMGGAARVKIERYYSMGRTVQAYRNLYLDAAVKHG
jgi:glycosyltransferase involved in cell wall biosynthesis